MAPYGFHGLPMIGASGHLFVLRTDERPELPAFQPISVTEVKERIDIIIGDNIAFPRLNIERHQCESNFITEKPVLETAVDGQQRRIIFPGEERPLLEIKWEQSKATHIGLGLSLATRKAEHLENLKAILGAKPIISEEGIGEIKLFEIGILIQGVGEQRRRRPNAGRFVLLMIEERTEGLRPMTGKQG